MIIDNNNYTDYSSIDHSVSYIVNRILSLCKNALYSTKSGHIHLGMGDKSGQLSLAI